LPTMSDYANIPVYCFSGLGADFRIFRQLKIPGVQLLPITWDMPAAEDTIASFAARLARQIKHPNSVLLGVSYGGMLVTEICATQPVRQGIVVSSCTQRNQLPIWLRAAGKLRLHNLVPYHLLLRSNTLNRVIFDPRSREEELYLKRLMLKDSDITFLKRSVKLIMQWDRQAAPENMVHIHGSSDRLLPLPAKGVQHIIPHGGHFMIWNQATEISRVIGLILNQASR
jgi:pimeloyl-ACP methyl ester carboxylesterase